METTNLQPKNNRTDRVPAMWRNLFFGSAVLFIACALLPFSFHESTTVFSSENTQANCLVGKACTRHNFLGWLAPSGIQVAEIVGLVALITLAITILWYAERPGNHSIIKATTRIHLVIVAIVIASTATAYSLLRNDSQAHEISAYNLTIRAQHSVLAEQVNRSCIIEPHGLNTVEAATLRARCIQLLAEEANATTHIGYGIAPTYLILESAVYLVVPLLNWYRFVLSPRYVGGQKKEELFQ